MKQKVLIIDDDDGLVDILKSYLEGFNFDVLFAHHPVKGLNLLENQKPDLLILDVMLPEMDGFEVCRRIRQESAVPIIMLTARGDLTDRVVGLELGADDYLAKPFEPRELVARIQSVLRRSDSPKVQQGFSSGGLEINFANHEVFVDKKKIDLTSTEFELLRLFVKHLGKVLNRDQILESISGINWESYNRSVDVLVSRLRQKLGDDPKKPVYLKTIWGSGYMFLGVEEK